MSADAASVSVEVVFAVPERQVLLAIEVPEGATVAEAIELSGIAGQFPAAGLESLPVGIWGREVARSSLVANGDRVEIYRPLAQDPKRIRRELAISGQTMSGSTVRDGTDSQDKD